MARANSQRYGLIAGDQILQAILEHGVSIVFVIDEQFRIGFINRVPSGMNIDVVLGASCLDYVQPEHRDIVRDTVEKVLRTGRPSSYEIQAQGPDQSIAWYASTVLPMQSEAGQSLVLMLTEDITGRKTKETDLRKNEAQFRGLIAASSDVVYRMSPDWSEMRYLDGRDFIADTHEPSQSWLMKYIHADDQARVLSAINEAIRERKPFELEHRVIRVDGSLGWTHSRAIPMLDEHGAIREWIGMASDVTARRTLIEALENSRHLLDLALSGAELGTWDFDLLSGEGCYDERYCAMLGYTLEEIEPTMEGWQRLVHPEDMGAVHEAIRAHRAGETRMFEVESRRRHKGGHWVWTLSRGKATYDDANRARRMTGTIQDISNRKRVTTEGVELLKKFEALIASLDRQSARAGDEGATAPPRAKVRLSGRNREVLQLIAEGKTSPEIAKALGISEGTAASHRRNLMRKLGLRNKAEVVRYAFSQGLVDR